MYVILGVVYLMSLQVAHSLSYGLLHSHHILPQTIILLNTKHHSS